jgi:uncharacterized protein YdhG (YjbR/CyaY superfamily)
MEKLPRGSVRCGTGSRTTSGSGWPPPAASDVSNEREGKMTDSIRSAKSSTTQAAKKAAARPGPRADKADGESALLAKIAAMPERDRAISERLHAIIKASAPALSPKLWYGMPAYAKDGKVVCFFRDTQKFKERYMTLGFNQEANLDEGRLWPIAFALTELTAAEEARIGALVKKAVS